MFGVGTSELVIILIIAILILGPKEIPKVARTIGKGMRELQRAKDELKKNIEFEEETVSQVKSDFREMINETEEEIKSEFKSPPPETKDQDNLS
ncbi:MAG: twin-arginine translocase TatA/TatE family subunit [Thermodesulfobacteriota bacterium]